ncbi:MAG TPA: glycoside hydrolase family 3 N-terminal domain-containing protein [Acidimicrobiales bacterium]|nr:glycoside hydrolase family 3 N-terminal domain-containing protein [Acidimicrobiales bacterium]
MTITTFEQARAAVRAGTSVQDAAAALVAAMTPEERLWCLDGDAPAWAGVGFISERGYHRAPFHAARVDRVGLPGFAFADGPRGCVIGNATAFPVTMARGATWDPELEERVGEVMGRELRAAGATLTGAVCVNVLRHPAWGRAQETYGEDPFLVGELGAALTRGLQRHVLACVKHFACNSMENARFSVDVEVDEVALHEVYLPHFRRIVQEGVAAVMSAYNSVNGEWAGQSHALLTQVLRDEWGFEGFVISDWLFGLRDAATSVAAGLDVEMPYRMVRATHLADALAAGEASWDDVDRSVGRVVATLLRFDEVLGRPAPPRTVLGAPEHRDLAREVAGRSVVLLRNEPVDGVPALPLRPDARLAVVGRLADSVNLGDGGSSDVWDLDCHTVLDGLRGSFDTVEHDDGSDPARAARLASNADAAVVVVGYTYLDEGEFIGDLDPALGALFPPADDPELVASYQADLAALPPTVVPERLLDRPAGFSEGGDRTSLRLAEADVALIRAVAAANPRTIVAIQAGSAVVVSDWVDQVPALVQSWYGGGQAGPGLADVLVGRVSPSARLPFSVPVREEDLPDFDRDARSFRYDRWHGWWHLQRTGRAPTFPFGWGLSYTGFALGGVAVAVTGAGTDGDLVVTGMVYSSGDRVGADVVQVYAALPDPDAPLRLVGFLRVEVPAAGRAPFRLTVPADRLATRDVDGHRWRSPRGRHTLTVARHVGDPDAVHCELELS